jgi:hypothetical protein
MHMWQFSKFDLRLAVCSPQCFIFHLSTWYIKIFLSITRFRFTTTSILTPTCAIQFNILHVTKLYSVRRFRYTALQSLSRPLCCNVNTHWNNSILLKLSKLISLKRMHVDAEFGFLNFVYVWKFLRHDALFDTCSILCYKYCVTFAHVVHENT